jgi:phosphonate transport system substrate-binding protein
MGERKKEAESAGHFRECKERRDAGQIPVAGYTSGTPGIPAGRHLHTLSRLSFLFRGRRRVSHSALMHKKQFIFAILASGLTLSFGPGCKKDESGSDSKKALKFSAIPDQDNKNLEKFNSIASHLSKELGVPVEYVASANYAASVTAFRNGDIQLAWFGGLTGVQAREFVPGAKAIAQGDTDPAFVSYVIAHKDSGLMPSSEFPKKIGTLNFTFGEPQSTSGRLMPLYYFEKETGIPATQFFKKGINFSKDHDATCELVQAGTFQAGVVNFSVFDKRVKEGKTDPNIVQVIWKTPPFADYNWTAHPDLEKTYGAGFTDKLQKALIDMTTKAPQLLEVFPRKAMIPAKNEDYEGIKAVAQSLGFLQR